MKCDVCGINPAQISFKGQVNGQESKLSLCHQCAQKQQLDSKALMGMPFPSFLQHFSSVLSLLNEPGEPPSCGSCGMSLAEFRQRGIAGCKDCYDVFHDLLEDALAEMHTGNAHCGKTADNLNEMIDTLRADLQNAVACEDYEQAAELKKEIERLEGNDS